MLYTNEEERSEVVPPWCYRNGPYPGIVAYSRIGKSWRLPDIVNSALATRQSYGVWTAVANRDGEHCVRASTWTLVYHYHPRYNVWHTSPYSCIRVMVPNSPHMAWVGPGEGTFTCQVNRSIRWESNPDLRHGSQSRWPPYYYHRRFDFLIIAISKKVPLQVSQSLIIESS